MDKKQTWSHYKRMLELFYADPDFRVEFRKDAAKTLQKFGLKLDVEIAREAVRIQTREISKSVDPAGNLYMNLFRGVVEAVQEKLHDTITLDKIHNIKLRAWVERQRKRMAFESQYMRQQMRAFTVPVCFELSKGCSGSCDFCCLSAEKLTGIFRYTKENKKLWKEILNETKDIAGEITAASACYLATEPFDNLDYEKFISDFHESTGEYPQTTTAASVKNIDRTRQFMKMVGEKHLKNAALRFSVVSLEQLKKIHQAFLPEELAEVELLLNNPESLYGYSFSGRARDITEKYPEKKLTDRMSSICVSGFVVNLVEKTVALVSPYPPDEKYPLGMKKYDVRCFTDAVTYRNALLDLIDKWMPIQVPENVTVALDPHIRIEKKENRISLYGDQVKRVLNGSNELMELLNILKDEPAVLQEVYQRIDAKEYTRKYLHEKIQKLYEFGYLGLA